MAREIVLCPYNKKWKEDFLNIKKQLLIVFADLVVDIQHFGSTSIVGMCAKPIIDVMVLIKDIQKVDDFNPIIIDAGYSPRGENGVPGRRYFVHFHEDAENHAQHIHVMKKTTLQ